MKIGMWLGSKAVEQHAKFQRETDILAPNLAVLRFHDSHTNRWYGFLTWIPDVGVSKSTFPHSVNFLIFQNSQNTGCLLNIIFRFNRTYPISAVKTHVNHEYDSKDVTSTFCKIRNNSSGKKIKTNRVSVAPTLCQTATRYASALHPDFISHHSGVHTMYHKNVSRGPFYWHGFTLTHWPLGNLNEILNN